MQMHIKLFLCMDMSLFTASLNSGSNGNCYYVGNDNEAVLIDVGISCKEIEKRMLRLNLSIEKIKAVFISHEHSDHIYGVPSFTKKYQIPVYITAATAKGITINHNLIFSFDVHSPIIIGNLTITAFPKLHDAVEPCSFIIEHRGIKVGVFTDIGFACKNVIAYFRQCHAAFLEANYDAEMLQKGRYPFVLKRRISGGNGHLSNAQALEIFNMNRPHFMTHLFLAHLSNNNNDPQIVEDLFKPYANNVHIIVASRFKETEVFFIQSHQKQTINTYHSLKPKQLAFAF